MVNLINKSMFSKDDLQQALRLVDEGAGTDEGRREAGVTGIEVWPAADVFETLRRVEGRVRATILDPWYNRGVGGSRSDYREWLTELVRATSEVSEHIYLWGFPEIVGCVLDGLPADYELVAWLTWYYKNCPSVIRGWRSSQMACLHIAERGAKVHPEHFLNATQRERLSNGNMRFIPGPPSVIETSLIVGFVGKKERTGHPAQKPKKTIEPLVLMATERGDRVLDPMCGSGTTGEVCRDLGRCAILCDHSEEYLQMTLARLGCGLSEPQSASPK